MDAFKTALEKLDQIEGKYSDNPVDRGGETYRGIARNMHPAWAGWRIIDSLKRASGFPSSIDADPNLQREVEAFYRATFWQPLCGRILDADVAMEIFDTGVNCGTHKAVTILQRALNLLNRRGRSWADLKVDGVIGNQTISALGDCLQKDKTSLLTWLNVLQGCHYVNLIEANETQEDFARGWVKRVQLVRAA